MKEVSRDDAAPMQEREGALRLPGAIRLAYTGLAASLALGCGPHKVDGPPVKPAAEIAAVPERALRLEFDLRDDSTFDATSQRDVVAEAVEQSVCLLRTEKADECKTPEKQPPICAVRSESAIRAAIERAFASLRNVRLRSRFAMQRDVQSAIPGAVATVAVRDARRDAECRDWGAADGPCVAVKVDKLWILLRSPWDAQSVGRFDVFLAEAACEAEPT